MREYLNRQPFDSERWKSAPTTERYDLAWDLHHGRLNGLTKSDVIDLLGEPTEGNYPNSDGWWYSLGCHKYSIHFDIDDTARLIITFEDDRAVSAVLE